MRSSFRKTYSYRRYGVPVFDDATGDDVISAPEVLDGKFSIQPAKLDDAMALESTLDGAQQGEVFKVYTDVLLETQRVVNGKTCRADEIIYTVGSRTLHLRVVKHMPNVATRLGHNKYYAQSVGVDELS